MGPTEINGLPAHVLLVHAVVVLIPLTALILVACAVSPALQRRLGLLLPVLALVSLATVPLATNAGEWLEHHMDRDPLLRAHAELGDTMLPWAGGLFLVAALVWWWGRRVAARQGRSGGAASVPVRMVVALVALVVSVGSVVQVYRIGDSGAKAAWHDQVSATAHGDSGDSDAK